MAFDPPLTLEHVEPFDHRVTGRGTIAAVKHAGVITFSQVQDVCNM